MQFVDSILIIWIVIDLLFCRYLVVLIIELKQRWRGLFQVFQIDLFLVLSNVSGHRLPQLACSLRYHRQPPLLLNGHSCLDDDRLLELYLALPSRP
jgi:hypothetical protein